MNESCLVLYLSSTAAQEDAARLHARRIPCRADKPPAGVTGGSCAYALLFPPHELARVRRWADCSGGIFCRGKDGVWRRAGG